MSKKTQRNKWYKASGEFNPGPRTSLYFRTKDGKTHIGRNLDYDQFQNLDGKIFEGFQVEEWKIRDWKREKGEPTIYNIQLDGYKVTIEIKQDIGHYWRATIQNLKPLIFVNKESKEDAISAIKDIIEKL